MDRQFERLKRELFLRGRDAIEDFIDQPIPDAYDKDTIESILDEAYLQMPQRELDSYYKKYRILNNT